MPQTSPMNAEGRDPYDFALEIEARVTSRQWTIGKLADELRSFVLAQSDRAILEAAAERALESIKYLADPDIDFIIKHAILSPLIKD